jgi:SAM-dependent methyltransferase
MSAAALLLSDTDIQNLDPYAFMAVLGKRVIHPGGRRSTGEMFQVANFAPGQKVLEVGCGVGTTAIELAGRFGVTVTAVDVDPQMVEEAQINIDRANVHDKVQVAQGDILNLNYPDNTFERVIIEAVTMFVERPRAVQEVLRVCQPGGMILDHEFIYRHPPTRQIRQMFEGEVCPGIQFDSAEDWQSLYQLAGLNDIKLVTGPFAMMTPMGFMRDEGFNCARMIGRLFTRQAFLKKMGWLMKRMMRVMPYLGYVVLAGSKPVAE